MKPHSGADTVISLAAAAGCDDPASICTADGRALSQPLSLTVPGPAGAQVLDADTGEPPPAPTGLSGTVNDEGHVVLTWTAPDDGTVTGYRILRRRPQLGENALTVHLADTESTATTWTDTDTTAGTRHVYRIKAINAAGVSGWSNYTRHTP